VVAPSLAVLALLLAQAAPTAPTDRVLVTAAPPLDAQRLADALGAYLGEFGIRVEIAADGPWGDLRAQLAGARERVPPVGAVAVIRAERGGPGAIDVEILDLATDKALVATVPRPARDEDLYRALALKIQAMLRATLSEARARLPPESALGRLVATPPEPALPRPRPLGLQAGYALVSFPIGGASFDGIAVIATHQPRPWLDLALGGAALGAAHASGGGAVDVAVSLVPITVAARLRRATRSFELLVGPSAQAALVRAAASSATTPVHSTSSLMLALGGEIEARVMIVAPAWLYLRASALGVLDGERYDVSGMPLVDVSRLQLAGGLGLALGWQ
jgi:hypothetical protein